MPQVASSYDFALDQGATTVLTIRRRGANGALLPLPTSARMDLRETLESEAVALALSSTGSGIVLDAPSKTIIITFSATASAALAAASYVHDLRFVEADASVKYPIRGTITMNFAVTR